MFFSGYERKKDGAIRFYDLSSPAVRVFCVLIFVLCLLMVAAALFPAVWVFLSGFKDIKEFRRVPSILPAAFDFQRYLKTWNDLKFARFYVNSLVSVAGSVVAAVLFNGLMAYGLGVLRPRGHRILLGLVLWSLLIPPTTGIVALYVNINRLGMSGSFLPLWLSMGANAFWVLLFKQFFETLPKDYIEAAQLDGCSDLEIFSRIILPLSKPILAVVAIFSVTAAWSDFLLPYLVLAGTDKETVMVRLFAFRTNIRATDVDILRAILFSILPPAALFALFQKQITAGIAAGGIKG
jgi:multiple sugar transport system permease protein